MNTTLYYFTGTGNSLYVAREIQKRIPNTELIPVVSLLANVKISTPNERIGFVFPLNGMTLPVPIKSFLKKLDVSKSNYFFAVVTRGGTKSFALKEINKYLRKKKVKLNAGFNLTMFNNDPKLTFFVIPTKDDFIKMEVKIAQKLSIIQQVIFNKEEFHESDTEGETFNFIPPVRFLLEKLILLGTKYAAYEGAKDYFYSDEKCANCGTCEKVCPSGKIQMKEDEPVWQKRVKCYYCYACVNYCPKEAIQIKSKWFMKSYTKEKGRYPHPYAYAKDIADQKKIR
ncbi:MAG: EFR1 family ferrodoxin [Candidatus Thorarchaeota archaeon]